MTAVSEIPEYDYDPWPVYEDVGFVPHELQRKCMECDARNRVIAGGRRGGKSQIGGHELIPEALMTRDMAGFLRETGKRREFWIVGPEYSDSEKEFRAAYNGLAKLEVPFDKPGTYYNAHASDMVISLWDGAFLLYGKSAKHPETLVGEGLSGVVMAEAAKLKERVWLKFIRPTLADFQGWALFSSTPEGKNWFYNLWQMGQDPKYLDWASWRFPSWANPYVYPKGADENGIDMIRRATKAGKTIDEAFMLMAGVDPEIAGMVLDMTETTFNQEIGALFTEFAGRVFGEFDEEIHVRDLEFQTSPKWQTYAAVDYGFTNPNVWLLIQLGPWGEIHILKEVYEPGLTINEFAAEIERRDAKPSGLIRFYPDPASPGSSRELSELLKVNYATAGTGGDLPVRLEAIRAGLKPQPSHLPADHPEKRPDILIDRSCVNTIREFNDYRYPKTVDEARSKGKNAPELPMKKDDHTPEAFGRFMVGHFGPRPTAPSHAVIRKARTRK